MEKLYEVQLSDGLGQCDEPSLWSEDEVRKFCAQHEMEFSPSGGWFDYDYYNAGSDWNPSWRSSWFCYEPQS